MGNYHFIALSVAGISWPGHCVPNTQVMISQGNELVKFDGLNPAVEEAGLKYYMV